jgi:large subunit ribosomal protein L10
MSENKKKKKVVIDNTVERFKAANGVIITDYQGLSVLKINDLRRRLEKAGADYKVVKNTLSKKALDEMNVGGDLKPHFTGVTGLVFCKDYMAAIKVLTAFVKENEKFKIKGGYIDAKSVTLEEIKVLSSIPSRQELLSKFVNILNSPIQRFINVLDKAAKDHTEAKAPEAAAPAPEAAPAPAVAEVPAAEVKKEEVPEVK